MPWACLHSGVGPAGGVSQGASAPAPPFPRRQVDDTEVINFLLSTEIIPLCLRTMETGSELSKTVATFIVQKILLDSVGLNYICATAERFFAVGAVLASMVTGLAEQVGGRAGGAGGAAGISGGQCCSWGQGPRGGKRRAKLRPRERLL